MELSEREKEVYIKFAENPSIKSLANDICISENTLKVHLHRIMTKLGCHTQAELVRIYYANRYNELLEQNRKMQADIIKLTDKVYNMTEQRCKDCESLAKLELAKRDFEELSKDN